MEENEILSEAEQIMENLIGKIRKDNNGDNDGDDEEENNPSEPDPTAEWNLNKVNKFEDEQENIIPIPKGFIYEKGTKNTGVVIKDTETNNEFVWIPTDEIEYERYDFSTSTVIINDSTEPDYNPAYTESVEKYGGFYIGRYEAGIGSPRTAAGPATAKPLFQKNKYPYIYVTWQQAKDLSVELYNTNDDIHSDLVNSYAWDTMLRWLSFKTGISVTDYAGAWGNYHFAPHTVTGWTRYGATGSWFNSVDELNRNRGQRRALCYRFNRLKWNV